LSKLGEFWCGPTASTKSGQMKLHSSLGENKNVQINWKHLGEDHQSNQTLAICNSFIHLWATSNILLKAGLYRIAPLKF